ncbi:Benzaldehyde dehydrogenase, mitochondrial-like protein [Drosera capensis]
MAATRRISSLISRSLACSSASSPPLFIAKTSGLYRSTSSYTRAALFEEEPVTPPVEVKYTKLLINGDFVDAASGKRFAMLDPRTGEVIAVVAECEAEDINRAVSAARKAFDEGPWSKMTAYVKPSISSLSYGFVFHTSVG